MIEELKYPKKYTEADISDPAQIYKPEFRFDTRGRLVMPLTPYQRKILHTTPGSKIIAQGGESESGGPQDDPASIRTGYIHADTTIKVGPTGGWVLYLSGGNASRPIQFGNETSGEVNFYLDSSGNVYMKGEISASSGSIGGWTISDADIVELYAGEGATRVGLRPGSYPFYAGAENPAAAPFRVTRAGTLICSNILITGGSLSVGLNSWHVDINGNMWWGDYGNYAAAVDKIAGSGLWARLTVLRTTAGVGYFYSNTVSNVNNVGLDLVMGAEGLAYTNVNPSIRIVHSGPGRIFQGTVFGAGGGILIQRSATSPGTEKLLQLISSNAL